MAKKLVYNSTFTPGAAGAGTIAILGNFPLKVFPVSYTHLTLPTTPYV